MRRKLAHSRAAVVPFDCGEGLIPGFCESVRGILSHLGCQAVITVASDVGGLAEAYEGRAELLFLADDYRFVTLAAASRRVVDNAEATARGYVAGLELLAGGLQGKGVLVIGCGPVGSAAAAALVSKGASVSLYDIKPDRCAALKRSLDPDTSGRGVGVTRPRVTRPRVRVQCAAGLEEAVRSHRLIVEASPAGAIIPADWVDDGSCVAAPGVPLGLSAAAADKLRGRVLHDPLQVGVATMLVEALKP